MDDIVEEDDLVEIVADGSPESPDEGITLNIDYTSTGFQRRNSSADRYFKTYREQNRPK